jgi:anti-sigma-K factor RskA
MSEADEIAAAEYVLGTLPGDERARFLERLSHDADLRAAVAQWQARLAPLNDGTPDEAPSPALWQALERSIAGHGFGPVAPDLGTNVVQLRRRVNFWRGATLATGALAAAMAGFVVLDRLAVAPEPEGARYVAVVDTGGREPALIAEVDTVTGVIRVRSLHAETPQGQSLELWHVAEGGQPRSLGILQAGADAQTIQDAAAAGPVSGVIAVTVEPQGGSPSGAPTGPIVYSGRLIPVEE